MAGKTGCDVSDIFNHLHSMCETLKIDDVKDALMIKMLPFHDSVFEEFENCYGYLFLNYFYTNEIS